MARKNDISIRLSVKDGAAVKKALKGMGKEGAAALRKIEASSKPASRGLKMVDRASKEAQSAITGLAERAGPLGNVLSALGPAGIAVGAGIGIASLAFVKAISIAREAVIAFDELAKSADDLGLSTTAFQALDFAAARAGVDNFVQSLSQMKIRAAEAKLGTGEMIEKLRSLNPELLKNIQNASNFEEQLRLIIGGLKDAKTETEFTTLASSTGGESFERFARALAETEDGLDGIIQTAQDFNVIVPETILRRSEEMKTKMDEAAIVIDKNLKQAFFDLAPALVQTKLLLSDLTKEFADFITTNGGEAFDNALSANAAALDKTINNLESAKKRLDTLNKGGFRAVAKFGLGALTNASGLSAQIETQITRLENAKAALFEARIEIVRDNVDSANPDTGGAGGGAGAGKSIIDPAQLALERQAAQIRAELGDITGLLAIREKELQILVEKTGLTREQANDVLAKYQAKLDGSAAAQKRWQGIVQAALPPTEKLRAQIAQLNADYDDGKISIETYNAANDALEIGLNKVADAARKNSQVFKDAQTIIKEVNDAREKALPLQARMANEQARTNALVKEGLLTTAQAALHMGIYGKSLADASQQSRILANTQQVMDGIITGQIDSFSDLATAFARALNKMVFDAIIANQKIAGAFGLGGFIGKIFGSFAGFLGITGATPVTAPGGGAVGGGAATVPFSFGGSKTKSPVAQGDTVFSAISALKTAITTPVFMQPGSAFATQGGDINLIIKNETGNQVRTQTRRAANGTREISIFLRGQMEGLIGGGELDDVFNRRFGARPVTGGG